jgi:hypothetical protein
VLCIWHSLIAVIIFVNSDPASSKSISPTDQYVIIDRYVFVVLFVFYTLIHFALFIWLIFVPYRRRREMEYYDRQYAAKKHIMINTTRPRYVSIQTQPTDVLYRRGSSRQGDLPSAVGSPMRPFKHINAMMVMPNPAIFLPIKEEHDELSYQTMTSTEVHDHDDVFYDQTSPSKNQQKPLPPPFSSSAQV